MSLRIDSLFATIWLDVSVILECDARQPTGIPRTANELLRAFWRSGRDDVRLCRFDLELGAYREVTTEHLLAFFAAPALNHSDSPKPPERTGLARFAQTLVACYRGVRRFLRPVRKLAEPWERSLVRAWKKIARCSSRKEPRPDLVFGPADVVVSVGGGWNYPGSAATCRQLRERMGFRSVHIIYDLIPTKCPQLFPRGFGAKIDEWMYETFQSADLLLTISRHTRRDVVEYCARNRLPAPPIDVIRLGELIAAGDVEDNPPAADGFDPAQAFVLSVGTIEIRKNHHLLYHVWRRLVEERGTHVPRLVVVGSPGWLTAEVLYQIREDPLTRDHIVLLSRCNDQELRWLYRHCLFTMYPSHYEGWGLPIAESLALGKYCIASGTSSMPEIGGDLVGMHDPCDGPACLRLVREALNPAFRLERENRIRSYYRRTSWDETARQLVGHIERHFAPSRELVAKSA